jgi:hypothetical protein
MTTVLLTMSDAHYGIVAKGGTMRCLGLGITGILIMGDSVAHQDTQLEGTERGSECKYFNSANDSSGIRLRSERRMRSAVCASIALCLM